MFHNMTMSCLINNKKIHMLEITESRSDFQLMTINVGFLTDPNHSGDSTGALVV